MIDLAYNRKWRKVTAELPPVNESVWLKRWYLDTPCMFDYDGEPNGFHTSIGWAIPTWGVWRWRYLDDYDPAPP